MTPLQDDGLHMPPVSYSCYCSFTEAPTFTMKIEPSLLLRTGQPLKLSCKVQGSPVLVITWFKNGSEITADHRQSVSFDSSIATLEIENCCIEDSGKYVCVASSEAGRDECSSSVKVKGWSRVFSSI